MNGRKMDRLTIFLPFMTNGIKAPAKNKSENVVCFSCCIYLLILSTYLSIDAHIGDPDKTASI